MRARWLIALVLAASACRSGGPAVRTRPAPRRRGPAAAARQEGQRGGGGGRLVRAQAAARRAAARPRSWCARRSGAARPSRASRCASSVDGGTLYSEGKVLVTDAAGRTRDRLTARDVRATSPSTPAAPSTGSACPLRTPDAAELARTGARRARSRAGPGPRAGSLAPERVLARPLDRLAPLRGRVDLPADPARSVVRPRDLDEVRGAACLRARAPPRADLPHGGHLALGPGRHRRHPGGAGARLEGASASSTAAARVWSQPGVVGGLPQPPAGAAARAGWAPIPPRSTPA